MSLLAIANRIRDKKHQAFSLFFSFFFLLHTNKNTMIVNHDIIFFVIFFNVHGYHILLIYELTK